MFKHQMCGFLAETAIHVGAGQMMGAIDLPVAREAATRYPYIPGSGLKGALREKVENQWSVKQANRLFGNEGSAAGVGVADARLLLLPIRTLAGMFRWVTCPYILERWARDLQMLGKSIQLPEWDIQPEHAWVTSSESYIILEEYSFKAQKKKSELHQLWQNIASLIAHRSVQKRMLDQLVVIDDDEFALLAQTGLHLYARNQLNDESKQSESLWYEEALPADTLLYSLLMSRNSYQSDDIAQLSNWLQENPYLQVGGNETIGQGWTVVSTYWGIDR